MWTTDEQASFVVKTEEMRKLVFVCKKLPKTPKKKFCERMRKKWVKKGKYQESPFKFELLIHYYLASCALVLRVLVIINRLFQIVWLAMSESIILK